ncbi:MAG: hypothetical protein DI549_21330 [Ancylobacter novellus]|uniref:Uncharacterized protein n=1 Tax=Ancylobacter novellus TaxID=921 RepID=A0A2W5S889_ANCNO|nr:MAG: hypothetical protein DI549_21330 [Ancylobacter novellus]
MRAASALRWEIWLQLALAVVTLALAAAGAGSILNVAFLPLAVGVAAILYQRSPTRDYVGFCLWIWMLAPLVRRLADWSAGFNDFSLIIIAPLAVSLLTVTRAIRKSFWSYPPFSMIIVVYCYGALLGMFQGQIVSATYTLATFMAPVFFGCYVLSYPGRSQEIAETMLRTFIYATFFISVYAIDQYFNLRPWDAYWLAVAEISSVGLPFPQMFRLFGTLNSPGPFAIMLFVGILAMFSSTSRLRWITPPLALVSLALTLGRSAWGGLAIGLLMLLFLGQGLKRVKYALIGLVAAILALPLLSYEPISEAVLGRLQSVSNLSEDRSYNARVNFVDAILSQIDSLVLGNGLGVSGLGTKLGDAGANALKVFDNGVLDIFYNFGLVGFFVILALVMMVYTALKNGAADDYARVSAAIAVGTISQIVFSNALNGFGGMCIFPFMAIVVSRSVVASRPQGVMPLQRAFAR